MKAALLLLSLLAIYIVARIGAMAVMVAAVLGHEGYSKLNESLRRFEWNIHDRIGLRQRERRRNELLNSIHIEAEPQENREARMKEMAEAVKLTRLITTAVKHLQTATKTCYDVQVFIARTFGYEQIAEVDAHPEAVRTREQVVDLIVVCIELMENYPKLFADSKLLHQLVGLKAMLEICSQCQLLPYTIATVPPICDPAKMMGNHSSKEER